MVAKETVSRFSNAASFATVKVTQTSGVYHFPSDSHFTHPKLNAQVMVRKSIGNLIIGNPALCCSGRGLGPLVRARALLSVLW